MNMLYQSAILGGTFDHFHAGHASLLSAAFKDSQHVTIGVVQASLSPDKLFPAQLEDYSTRESNLRSYLQDHNLTSRVTIIPISDIYGTSLTDPAIQAIFVTTETKTNAEKINVERQKLGLTPLTIIVVPYALGDDEQIISSGRIRAGEIDREGRSYRQFFLSQSTYRLPESLRPTLASPIGPVFTDVQKLIGSIPASSLIIAVGDIVSLTLKQAGYPAGISIIDYRTERRNLDRSTLQSSFPVTNYSLPNLAGTINPAFAPLFLSALAEYQKSHTSQVVVVDGEEDLLALPTILLSPLNTFIIYGQSGVGMVLARVTEKLKSQIKSYLEQF